MLITLNNALKEKEVPKMLQRGRGECVKVREVGEGNFILFIYYARDKKLSPGLITYNFLYICFVPHQLFCSVPYPF